MKITNLTTDDVALQEIGRRMAEARLVRQMTQAQFAQTAGVSKRTIERLEDGASIQSANLIRCLRALDQMNGLERLLPQLPANPLTLLERQGKARQRARPGSAGESLSGEPWSWDDET